VSLKGHFVEVNWKLNRQNYHATMKVQYRLKSVNEENGVMNHGSRGIKQEGYFRVCRKSFGQSSRRQSSFSRQLWVRTRTSSAVNKTQPSDSGCLKWSVLLTHVWIFIPYHEVTKHLNHTKWNVFHTHISILCMHGGSSKGYVILYIYREM
jgi:hypothetical protein